MQTEMATTKSTRKPARSGGRAPEPKATRGEGRRKSLLMLAAEEAARALLLKTLRAQDWNLTATAQELNLTGPSNVLHAIRRYDLTEEYEKARDAGKISPGNRMS